MEDSTGWLPHVAINGWFAGDAASGSGQYVEHLLSRLPKIANTVRWSLLIPARKDMIPERMTVSYPGIAVFAIGLPPLPENLAKLWWEQVAVPRAAQRLRAHELWIPYRAAPWWQPVPTVVTIHDLIPTLLPAYRGGLLQRLYTQLVSVTAKRAQAVLTVSYASKRDIVERLKLAPDRVFVVHHGPNQEEMPAVSEDDRALVRVRYRLPERFFLYLGGFDVRKNVPTVIAAYRRYLDRGGDPAVKLVIAGRSAGRRQLHFSRIRKRQPQNWTWRVRSNSAAG